MRRRVLVVEDDLDDSIILSQVIELVFQQEATRAKDGAEAIRLATSEIFDLVLLDLQLPGLAGWDVAKTLREMERYRTVPIIAVTAYDMTEALRRSLQAGCSVYLTKPINVEVLIDLLSAYLPKPHG